MSKVIIKKGTRELLIAAREEAQLYGIEVDWETQGDSRHPKLILMHADRMAVIPFSGSPRTNHEPIRGRQAVRRVAREWGVFK